MKFPKYTREENRSCKLSEKNIEDIKSLKKSGYSNFEISRLYKVSKSTVYYWSLSKEKQNYLNTKKRVSKLGKKTEDERKCYLLEYRKRKKTLHPELSEYELEKATSFKESQTYKNKKPTWDKNYYLRNKEVILNRVKSYHLKNPDVHKQAMKRYRLKIKKPLAPANGF